MPRKRPYKRLVEVNTDDHNHVEDNTHTFALHGNDQIYLEDNNLQVRHQHYIHIIVIINNSIS